MVAQVPALTEVFAYAGHNVRVVTIDGDPWFVAVDVCAVLGLSNPAMATAGLDEDEKGLSTADTLGGGQQVLVVNEPGLYSLVLRSRKSEAKAFKRWITHEVLPQIRKTGTFSVATLDRRRLAELVIEAEDARAEAEARAAQVAAELEAVAPKAAAADAFIAADGDYDVRAAAQMLARDFGISTGQRRLFATLREIGWLDPHGRPYQSRIDGGWLTTRAQTYEDPNSGERVAAKPQIRITTKGIVALHRILSDRPGQLAITADRSASS